MVKKYSVTGNVIKSIAFHKFQIFFLKNNVTFF